MSTVTDMHSHILPRMDDGSRSVEESIAMLRMEAEQGITKIVATPHFYPNQDSPEQFLRRREESVKILQESMAGFSEMPALKMGAEVQFFSGMSHSDLLSALTIDKCNGILIEMPHGPWTTGMLQELEKIHVRLGLVPIIAHIDRYIRPFKTYGIPERLRELPVMVQANASFFLSGKTSRLAFRLLKEDKIHVLGSDCHRLETRPPRLGEAVSRIEKRMGPDIIRRIQAHERELWVE